MALHPDCGDVYCLQQWTNTYGFDTKLFFNQNIFSLKIVTLLQHLHYLCMKAETSVQFVTVMNVTLRNICHHEPDAFHLKHQKPT